MGSPYKPMEVLANGGLLFNAINLRRANTQVRPYSQKNTSGFVGAIPCGCPLS